MFVLSKGINFKLRLKEQHHYIKTERSKQTWVVTCRNSDLLILSNNCEVSQSIGNWTNQLTLAWSQEQVEGHMERVGHVCSDIHNAVL